MSEIVWPITKYGKRWYKVVLGHSRRWLGLPWRRHVVNVNPKARPHGNLPSGEVPEMVPTSYHRGLKGYDPDKGKRLVSIQGFGIVTESDYGEGAGDISADLRTILTEIFESLGAVPLRGDYIPTGGGRRVPLGVLLLGDDAERQAYRLALWLARQADVLREPTTFSELHGAAMQIVGEVNHITFTGAL